MVPAPLSRWSCRTGKVESDNKSVIELSATELVPPWESVAIFHDIHASRSRHGLDFRWIPRTANRVIGSIIRKSRIGLFSKPLAPALPPIAKSDAIKVKKDDAPIAKSTAIKVKKDDVPTIRWRKDELIGCGAFGRVYMGLNINSGALLAIKQVSIAGNSAAKEKTRAHIRELEEEVNLLENLSHPNIVRYLGTTREDASLNILLEIVPGGSISSLLGKFGSFPESVIRMYTKQLLLGVEYLHRNGIMHRDIKGANILVDNKGCIKLADFGASKKVVELATMTGAKSMKGTPYWMAPEVILQTGHSL
ncbi:mitogen-activated protein kinase kinase kinase NPK1-like [Camellia sinensis]|uniref:mitogen-activated protein kinase kinase kinase NPK1-like n=1 Tax=Camellia sinensis TaxID=4442 RepID=UPI0010360BC7|nr:mitogen-activated protein kinase kinase kinase NPK1-like [Camellia sinensis]